MKNLKEFGKALTEFIKSQVTLAHIQVKDFETSEGSFKVGFYVAGGFNGISEFETIAETIRDEIKARGEFNVNVKLVDTCGKEYLKDKFAIGNNYYELTLKRKFSNNVDYRKGA